MNRPYTPFDIIWIKNISNRNVGHAYMELIEDEFTLHFPSHHKGNVLSPKIGELILLHQNINEKKVFTHLVAPVDDIRIEEDRENYRYGRRVIVIAKTDIDTAIPISSTLWNEINFQGISQGNACEIANISNIGAFDFLLQNVWNKFIPYFTPSFADSTSFVSNAEAEIYLSEQDISVTEGILKLVTHYARERDRNIVRTKKQQAIDKGILVCEVCDFSFINKFGIEFIECHHKTPISQSGVTETTLDDLGLVCANCHRMLHKQFDGQYLTIEELRRKIS